jgi:NADPH:quinone reductase-like Zn-dependent oxidoreductase
MKAWLLKDFGLDHLGLEEVSIPQPKKNEILIKVSAVSLNFRDKAIVDGMYRPDTIPKPLIPVSDAVGVVVALGPGVTRFKEGDRVNTVLYSGWVDGDAGANEPDYCYGGPLPGGLAEYMILRADSAVKAPEALSDEEASTLPIAALTAWFALMEYGNLQTAQTVLVQGTGGVSIFGVQIAAALGAKVIATSSSDEKLERVKALGAWEGINYTKFPAWEKKALELTNGRGVDQLLDVVGGDGLNQSIAATRVAGRISQIGFLGGLNSNIDILQLLLRQTEIRGIAVVHTRSFERMNLFFDQHKIRPVIDRSYSFHDAVEAYRHLGRGAFGKVVIRVAE